MNTIPLSPDDLNSAAFTAKAIQMLNELRVRVQETHEHAPVYLAIRHGVLPAGDFQMNKEIFGKALDEQIALLQGHLVTKFGLKVSLA